MLFWCTLAAAAIWAVILFLPWRPWAIREHISAAHGAASPLISQLTALIPARDEAACIADTLRALSAQGTLARIVLIDDESSDGTGDIARGLGLPELTVLRGTPPDAGWSGKLWALEQGFALVETEYTLLLDADIALAPGILTALAEELQRDRRDLVSGMATLQMATLWESLLIPPFIYFFKLLYPFALANSDSPRVAAAAGGCVLVRTGTLRAIGGFAALRDALIDDCTLACKIKAAGGRTWVGLSRDIVAIRPYGTLANIWNMVARTAYTQLRYSLPLLLACTVLLGVTFVAPVAGVWADNAATRWAAAAALAMMLGSYLPILRYYGRSPLWAATLPFAAVLYLAMTWTSAVRYLRGERSRWKDRVYSRDLRLS